MANKLLLQTLLKNKNNIRDGIVRIQDVVTDYFRMGGKNLEVNDRAIIEDFFVKESPSNVTSMDMAEQVIDVGKNPNTPYSMSNDLKKRNPGLEFTDDMTFGQVDDALYEDRGGNIIPAEFGGRDRLLSKSTDESAAFPSFKTTENIDEVKQGLGSLPKGVPGEIFDTKNAARADMASFINKMRDKGVSNTDIAGVRKVPGDEQKATAELLVNQNEMGADTIIKQEFMEEFTELKNTKGPRFFKEEFQGYDSYGDLVKNKGIEARNAIVDDLDALGIADEEVMSIARNANEIAAKNPFSPEAWITAIKQDLELSNIKYDMRFWDNYFNEVLNASAKETPMFRYGGLV